MNLILLENEMVMEGGARALLHPAQVRHAREVLHVTLGSTLKIGLIDGPRGIGTVTMLHAEMIELSCSWEASIPSRPLCSLLLAMPRPKVMRRLWAQLAALGVDRIWVSAASRVERNYFASHAVEEETYRPLLLEGLQQAACTRLPVVEIIRHFPTALAHAVEHCPTRIMLHPYHPHQARPSAMENCCLAIGPEGGWTSDETALLMQSQFLPTSLGPRILRTDTACIAALTLCAMK